MDKHLRPSRFECEPNASNAEKQWKHWYRTYENFINSINFAPETTNEERDQQKLSTLINYVSPSVYEFIAEAPNYVRAINILRELYVKPVNIMYNRHVLITHRQGDTETVNQYLHELERLSKNCNFADVSAEEYRQEYVRDAFINGLHSPVIRQRLLESHTLTLQQAFQQARTLELAQKHSTNFQSTSVVAAVDADGQAEASVAAIYKAPTVGTEKQKCFFCGNDRHPRNKCPAKDSVCNKCTKIGHWVRVCRSTKSDSKFLGAVLSHNQPNSNQPLLCSAQTVKPSQTVNDRNKDSSMTTTYVKNFALKTLIDTGSDLSFISEKVADKSKLFILPIP